MGEKKCFLADAQTNRMIEMRRKETEYDAIRSKMGFGMSGTPIQVPIGSFIVIERKYRLGEARSLCGEKSRWGAPRWAGKLRC